jgi:predicted nucleic acid-binding protein
VSAYVLDASVAAKWFLPGDQESLKAEALTVLQEYAAGRLRLVVPDLFWPEIGNILWKASRMGRMPKSSALQAIEILREQSIATYPSFPLFHNAFTIATSFDRSVYDSIYIALAVEMNATFLTADERLVNALASRFPVRWLGSP